MVADLRLSSRAPFIRIPFSFSSQPISFFASYLVSGRVTLVGRTLRLGHWLKSGRTNERHSRDNKRFDERNLQVAVPLRLVLVHVDLAHFGQRYLWAYTNTSSRSSRNLRPREVAFEELI